MQPTLTPITRQIVSYSSVDDVYEGQHKSSVSLGLGTGVLQLSLTVFTLRELKVTVHMVILGTRWLMLILLNVYCNFHDYVH